MDVDAVNCKRLEARDLQLALRHGLLRELKLSVHRLDTVSAGAAAVAASLDRRNRAVVEGEPVVEPVCGVGHTKYISPASIWRPGDQKQSIKLGNEDKTMSKQLKWFLLI